MCKRRGRKPHFGKKGVLASLNLRKMHENANISTNKGSVRRVRPMLDPLVYFMMGRTIPLNYHRKWGKIRATFTTLLT